MADILVELCAGSAAVSLRWLRADARPPIAYMGSKRGYADQILGGLGLVPGGGRGRRVVLCEPGPWGEAWALWRTPEGRSDTFRRLWAWQDQDTLVQWGAEAREDALWDRLRAEPVPEAMVDRVAAWCVLQDRSWGGKPVLQRRGRWATHGRDAGRPSVLRLAEMIESLPDLSRVEVHHGPAQEVEPIPGAVCLIDPPYAGTTCSYGHGLPRKQVLAIAEHWQAAGATVVVCEAEPLPLPGWHHLTLSGAVGRGRTWSRQQREVLTISKPPRGQLALLGGDRG